jgi:NADPH:quinone reductase-like Zn-dependent oxidoreductase
LGFSLTGADDVIIFGNEKGGLENINNIDQVNLINELNLQDKFDLIFLTRCLNYDYSFLKKFLNPDGLIIDCVEPDKDNLSYFKRVFYKLYVRFRQLLANGQHIEWGDNHFCNQTLDRLAMMVNDGVLQTVVDTVFTAEVDNCEQALKHICKEKRIGGTIITFR